MKKKTKKMELRTETIAHLTDRRIAQVHGGGDNPRVREAMSPYPDPPDVPTN